jgi:hypothetical protein
MFAKSLRKIVCCAMAIVVPIALYAGDTNGAMLYTSGTTWLNGNAIPKSSAVFSGDTIQTREDSVANLNATGATVNIGPDSLLEFQGDGLKLERGAVSIWTEKGLVTRIGEVTVTPASNSTSTEFEVKDTYGTIVIVARKGSLVITDAKGTSTLAEGQQATRDESEPQKKKRRRVGGALPGGTGSVMDSPTMIYIGLSIVTGVTLCVLFCSGDDPPSPSRPAN